MKICYFADGQSIHTQKWCTHFANLGHEVHLITFRDCRIDRVHVHFLNVGTIATAVACVPPTGGAEIVTVGREV